MLVNSQKVSLFIYHSRDFNMQQVIVVVTLILLLAVLILKRYSIVSNV